MKLLRKNLRNSERSERQLKIKNGQREKKMRNQKRKKIRKS